MHNQRDELVTRGHVNTIWRRALAQPTEDAVEEVGRIVRADPALMLAGKRLLVTGVVTRHSIAWTVARRAQEAGAEVVLTGFGRGLRLTERAANALPDRPDVLELDVNSQADVDSVAADLGDRWGALDGVLHAIAYAPADALGGEFLHTPEESATPGVRDQRLFAQTLAVGMRPLLAQARGSVVGLDFDASSAWPGYDWMGVAKAGLDRSRATWRATSAPTASAST